MPGMSSCALLAAGLLSVAAALPYAHDSPPGASDSTSSLQPDTNVARLPRLITYVQNFRTTTGNNISLLPIENDQTRVSHVILAATHINAQPGDIHLNNQNPNDTSWDMMWTQAAQLQQSGIKVMMMLGGAAPGSYPRLCSGDPLGQNKSIIVNDDYYLPLYYTLKYHNVDGLDLDIEEQVSLSCPLALLRRLYHDFGPQFILTMAPVATDLQPVEVGLGGFSYSALDAQAVASDKPNGKLVNWYNTQFYNGWGDASSPVGYNAIINNGYNASRVVLGVLDSPNDGGSGWYPISTYISTINQLQANYPDFGDVVSWEYYDAGLGDEISGAYQNDPWVWDRQMGSVVFEAAGKPAEGVNLTASPVPAPQTPWPGATQEILAAGGSWAQATWALNRTSGDLSSALRSLGLVDGLLSKILPS